MDGPQTAMNRSERRSSTQPDLAASPPAASVSNERDDVVIWMCGEHDASTCDALSSTFSGAMGMGTANVVVDLSGVQFMNAATVRVLVGARDEALGSGRALTFRAPSRCASRVLGLCGLELLAAPAPSQQESARLRER